MGAVFEGEPVATLASGSPPTLASGPPPTLASGPKLGPASNPTCAAKPESTPNLFPDSDDEVSPMSSKPSRTSHPCPNPGPKPQPCLLVPNRSDSDQEGPGSGLLRSSLGTLPITSPKPNTSPTPGPGPASHMNAPSSPRSVLVASPAPAPASDSSPPLSLNPVPIPAAAPSAAPSAVPGPVFVPSHVPATSTEHINASPQPPQSSLRTDNIAETANQHPNLNPDSTFGPSPTHMATVDAPGCASNETSAPAPAPPSYSDSSPNPPSSLPRWLHCASVDAYRADQSSANEWCAVDPSIGTVSIVMGLAQFVNSMELSDVVLTAADGSTAPPLSFYATSPQCTHCSA